MSAYTREFCSDCKARTVHEDGLCVHHEEFCFECGRGIRPDEGRYRITAKKTRCEKCGEKVQVLKYYL
jgi:hypothetical protein